MLIKYKPELQGWMVHGTIDGRHIVVLSKDMLRGMQLYQALERAGKPQQDVYLAEPEHCEECRQLGYYRNCTHPSHKTFG